MLKVRWSGYFRWAHIVYMKVEAGDVSALHCEQNFRFIIVTSQTFLPSKLNSVMNFRHVLRAQEPSLST